MDHRIHVSEARGRSDLRGNGGEWVGGERIHIQEVGEDVIM